MSAESWILNIGYWIIAFLDHLDTPEDIDHLPVGLKDFNNCSSERFTPAGPPCCWAGPETQTQTPACALATLVSVYFFTFRIIWDIYFLFFKAHTIQLYSRDFMLSAIWIHVGVLHTNKKHMSSACRLAELVWLNIVWWGHI